MALRDKTYFISDTHLGSHNYANPLEVERRVVRWLDSVKDDAKDIYMLGDILDYWYEYRYLVPKGYIRFFGKLAEIADLGVGIHWIVGNHDVWLYSYLQEQIGVEVLDGNIIREIDGWRVLMAHGDGVGNVPLSMRIIRTLFRSRLCQWLYSMLPVSLSMAFANGWSVTSRKGNVSLSSERRSAKMEIALGRLRDFCRGLKGKRKIDYFIFGHLHCFKQEDVNEGESKMVILGSWDKECPYVVLDSSGLQLSKMV